MATKTINGKIRNRIDTSKNWSNKNPVLLAGEIGIESDTFRLKAGDGSTSWNNLPYLRGPADLYIGDTEPTAHNTVWIELKE